MKLGISGPPGSGKDVVASYLVDKYGFTHISTGDVLRHEADRRGLDHMRSTLQRLGSNIRNEHGRDILLDAALASAVGRTVFTGIRTIGAAQAIAQVGKLVYVDAPLEVRYERCIGRGRNVEAETSFAEFAALDKVEHLGSDEVDTSLNRVHAIAHYIITNDRSTGELYAVIDDMIDVNTLP